MQPGIMEIVGSGQLSNQATALIRRGITDVNRQDLIDKIADATGLTKKGSGDALDATLNAISDALAAGDKVSLVGFGTFEARERAARDGFNPQTGEKIKIAAKTVPAFRPGAGLRAKVDG